MSDSSLNSPSLSIVIATTHPWPAVRECLEILAPQAAATGAQIVLGDSTGEGLPDPLPEHLRSVRWLKAPGASVFELRARATEASLGAIVAWTEDHCRPAANWCQLILAAHQGKPEAEAVSGAIVNGSTTSTIDWANFLMTFGPFLPPLNPDQIRRAPPAANVSFKRSTIPAGAIAPGWIELVVARRLLAERRIAFDERILVEHVQSKGLTGTLAAHFHNGRSTTGLLAQKLSPARRLRGLLICPVLPAPILITMLRPLIGKAGVAKPLLKSLPLIVMLAIAHAAGEFTGLVLNGPGESPKRLE